jgi:hypothetical protein
MKGNPGADPAKLDLLFRFGENRLLSLWTKTPSRFVDENEDLTKVKRPWLPGRLRLAGIGRRERQRPRS